MHEFGYQWSEMLPLTKERALELYDLDVPVLMLHPDNSESVTEEKRQLMEHGGMFGVERSDWNDYLAQKDLVQEQNEVTLILSDEEEHTFSYPFPVKAVDIEETGGDRTAVFKVTDIDLDTAVIEFHNGFHGTDLEKIIAEEYGLEWVESIDYEDGTIIKPEIGENQAEQVADKQEESLQPDTYSIYQLKDGDETRDYRFMDMEFLTNHNMTVDRANYDLVYSGTLAEDMTLNTIYEKFNIDYPADFTGHSLSVSDIVVLHQNVEDTSHYVDSFGFKEVPDFMKEQSLSAEKDKVGYYVI